MRFAIFFGYVIIALAIIIGIWFVLNYPVPVAHGQEAQTTKAPPAAVPTQSATPITISPNPNFEYLPQKAYVQTYKPEIGVPVGQQPLTSVPQVVPVQPAVAQNNTVAGIDMGSLFGILGTLSAAGAYLKGHLVGKKTDKVEEISKEQSAQIVKGAEVDQSLANRVYENMPDKGESITDAPEIKLEKLAENKEEAVKTATKA